jgi:hypothetical protein
MIIQRSSTPLLIFVGFQMESALTSKQMGRKIWKPDCMLLSIRLIQFPLAISTLQTLSVYPSVKGCNHGMGGRANGTLLLFLLLHIVLIDLCATPQFTLATALTLLFNFRNDTISEVEL